MHELDCADPMFSFFNLASWDVILCLYRLMSAGTTQRCCAFLKSDRHGFLSFNLTFPRDWERSRRYRSLEDCFRFLQVHPEAFLFTAVHADFDALVVDDCADEARSFGLELVEVKKHWIVPIIS